LEVNESFNQTIVVLDPDEGQKNTIALDQTLTLISNLNFTSEFLNFTSKFLTYLEQREIFLNSLEIINGDLKDPVESEYFVNDLKKTLNQSQIVEALKKSNFKNETVFYKTLRIESETLNLKFLNLIEEYLSDQEIFELFTKQEIVFGSTIFMVASQYQDRDFYMKFIDFIQNHTTEAQFRSILLQRDHDNDTMLQYAHNFIYADNFVHIANIYKSILSDQEIIRTFLDRKKLRLPSFSESIKSASENTLTNVANLLDSTFDDESLRELLTRRDENGETIFSLYGHLKIYREKMIQFVKLLKAVVEPDRVDEFFKRKV
jgi:hypothetical protein